MTDNDTYHSTLTDCDGEPDEVLMLTWQLGEPPSHVRHITTAYGSSVCRGIGGWVYPGTNSSFNPVIQKWVATDDLLSLVRHENQ